MYSPGRFLVVGVCLGAAATAVRADAPPPDGTELFATDIGWPATTVAATLKKVSRVFDGPSPTTEIGMIATGARVTWKHIVASSGTCTAWVEIEPRGWVCAKDLTPSNEKPSGNPSAPITPMIRDRAALVKPAGADVFDDVAAIKARKPSRKAPEHEQVMIKSSAKWSRIDDVYYVRTEGGWMSSHDLWWYDPKVFVGIELAANAPLDFGWVIGRRPGAGVAVREAPSAKAKKVREVPRQVRVDAFETQNGFTRIGTDEWVDKVELRRVEKRPRPLGVGPNDRWIDIDLDHQSLLAYEGDTPVFATLVATGRIKWGTPTGVYRIKGKDALLDMRSPPIVPEEDAWDIKSVPWSMRFRKNFAIHAAYWHDGFGRARSHGCVNLSTTDARRVYEWVNTPDSPPGWISTNVDDDPHAGTVVRIRSSTYPNPRYNDYAGNAIDPITKELLNPPPKKPKNATAKVKAKREPAIDTKSVSTDVQKPAKPNTISNVPSRGAGGGPGSR